MDKFSSKVHRVHMELGGKLLDSLRIETQFLERLQSVSVVDGATHTQKDDVESNGGSLEMLQRSLCCFFAAFSWFWCLVSSQYILDLAGRPVRVGGGHLMRLLVIGCLSCVAERGCVAGIAWVGSHTLEICWGRVFGGIRGHVMMSQCIDIWYVSPGGLWRRAIFTWLKRPCLDYCEREGRNTALQVWSISAM